MEITIKDLLDGFAHLPLPFPRIEMVWAGGEEMAPSSPENPQWSTPMPQPIQVRPWRKGGAWVGHWTAIS